MREEEKEKKEYIWGENKERQVGNDEDNKGGERIKCERRKNNR